MIYLYVTKKRSSTARTCCIISPVSSEGVKTTNLQRFLDKSPEEQRASARREGHNISSRRAAQHSRPPRRGLRGPARARRYSAGALGELLRRPRQEVIQRYSSLTIFCTRSPRSASSARAQRQKRVRTMPCPTRSSISIFPPDDHGSMPGYLDARRSQSQSVCSQAAGRGRTCVMEALMMSRLHPSLGADALHGRARSASGRAQESRRTAGSGSPCGPWVTRQVVHAVGASSSVRVGSEREALHPQMPRRHRQGLLRAGLERSGHRLDPGRRTTRDLAARLPSNHITLTSASTLSTPSNATNALNMTAPWHSVSYQRRLEEATRTTTQTAALVTGADAFHQSRG